MLKRLILTASISSALLVPFAQAGTESAGDIRAAVVAVLDGDSFIIEPNGMPMQIDLESADAPEREQPFGDQAKEHLEKLILGKAVVIKQSRNVEYRHITGIASLNGKEINREMISDGFAWIDESYGYASNLKPLQDAAEKSKLGLWSQKKPQNPKDFIAGPQQKNKMPEITVSYPEVEGSAPTEKPPATADKAAASTPSTMLPPPPPKPLVPMSTTPTNVSSSSANTNQKVFLNAEKIQQAREKNIQSQPTK
jgi:endonuclease YncB( thermonuclease family)